MARKGQKYNKYTPEFKKKILYEYYNEGGGYKSLGKKYSISWHTIEKWVKQSKNGIDVSIDHHKGRSGRPKSSNLTIEDYKERYEILKKYQAFLEARQEKK